MDGIFVGVLIFLGLASSVMLYFSLYGHSHLMNNSREGFSVSVCLIGMILLILWIINDLYNLHCMIDKLKLQTEAS